jgi:uncharacterized protein (TIGR02145 family)
VSDAAGNTVMRTLELRVPYTPADATVDFTEFAPCPEAAVGTVWYLTDTRAGGNNNTYKVKKLQDNRIWMVQDLKFGTCPNSTASWNNDNSEAATTAGTTVYTGYVGHCRSSSQANAGYLYNWPAAMQSTKAYKGSSDNSFQCTGTSGSACQGICPSGWHIPTGNTAGEFNILHSVSGRNCSTSNDDCWDSGSTFEGVIGGYCSDGGSLYGQGSYADYWSSTYSSNGDAYFQYFDSAYTGRGTDSNSKGNGRSVRCVRNY